MEPKELDDKRAKDIIPPPDISGVNTGAILKFCIALVVVAVVVHMVVWWLFNILDNRSKSQDPQLSPLFPKQQVLPSEPRLQAIPNKTGPGNQIFDVPEVDPDLQTDEELLREYGWIDPQNGIVRIPITEAMKIVAEQEKQTQTAPATQTNVSTNEQK
jgi:hypothetical protein